MKKGKKMLAILLGTTMALGLTACGGEEAGGRDESFQVTYDNSLDPEVLESVPDYQFVAADLSYMIAYGSNLDVVLDLKADGTYTLNSKYYGADEEGAPGYLNIQTNATGTYTKEGDQVTISAAQTADAVYQGGAYITEQGMFLPFSFSEDGSVGEWTSAEVPEILECVPETVFTVTEDGAIVTWEAAGTAQGNPHAPVEEEVVASEETAVQESEAGDATEAGEETDGEAMEVAYTIYASDTQSIYMDFAVDGTCVFHFADYGISEDCTWSYADGVVTITNPNGDTVDSVMDGDMMTITYVAAASDQLIGNLAAEDWADFFQ